MAAFIELELHAHVSIPRTLIMVIFGNKGEIFEKGNASFYLYIYYLFIFLFHKM